MELKVLTIEDNKSDQILNELQLANVGASTTTCDSCEQALEHLLTKKFDLILLDLMLPEISGFQFLLGFRNAPLNSDTPVVVLTSRDGEVNFRNYCESLSVVKKPLQSADIKTILQQLQIQKRAES